MSYLKYVILLSGIIFIPLNVSHAQIQLGGLADFEIRKGGSESSMYVNQTPNGKWAVYTPAVRLFLIAISLIIGTYFQLYKRIIITEWNLASHFFRLLMLIGCHLQILNLLFRRGDL